MSKICWGTVLAMVLAGAAQAQTVTVCAERWVPFVYRDDNGEVKGLGAEVLQQVARQHDATVHFQFLSMSGCYKQAAAGRADVVAFATARETPAGWLQNQRPLVYWPLHAWVSSTLPEQRYHELQQFAGLRVAWVPSYDYPQPLVKQTHWRRVEAPDTQASFTMLAGGRVDVVFDDYQATQDIARQLGGRVKRLEGLVASHHETFSIRPGLEWLRDGIEQEAARLAENGTLEQFYLQYFRVSWGQVLAVPH
ncbi:ABC transporter substrate-binding protein [Vogesella sp. LIG4]|uniref:substrate-binding periplasmic protein n=1 Tax=Vogesella sp. LIG4 TaxID=1192162 RepID=UPI00081FEA7B|nr:transporter substrate-binding domain-containing protein [Vogesella sp. LIG4]SCK19793.1 ABC-type amino acid transport substrate-binding protein [Vogesella sp. LIG4]